MTQEPLSGPAPTPEEQADMAARRAQSEQAFQKELEHLINRHSLENGSNTPDFILAEYLMGCLRTFNAAMAARSAWFN